MELKSYNKKSDDTGVNVGYSSSADDVTITSVDPSVDTSQVNLTYKLIFHAPTRNSTIQEPSQINALSCFFYFSKMRMVRMPSTLTHQMVTYNSLSAISYKRPYM